MRTSGPRAFERSAALASIALVALLLLPTALAAHPAASGTSASSGALSAALPSASLPNALRQPFAERAGFSAEVPSDVQSVHPFYGNVSVVVTLWPRSLAFFDPGPSNVPPLSTDQVRAVYGATDSAYDSILGYFTSQGLRVVHAWPDHLSLTLAGSATSVSKAFATQLVQGSVGQSTVQFPATPPSLPAPFEAQVASVSGLRSGFTSFSLPFSPLPLKARSIPASAGVPAAGASLIWPTNAHSIYGLDGLYNFSGTTHWASGVGIALLLWGWGYSPSDLGTFFSTYYPSSFPTYAVKPFPVDGAPAPSANAVNDPSNAPQELTLDLEWAGSEAPGATLDAVYAPDGPAPGYSPTDVTMEDALNTAVNSVSGVQVISMSFGTEDGADLSFQAAYASMLAEAKAKGITVLAASGDNGGTSAPGCKGNVAAEYPAASPDVIAVGGTAPVLSYDALGQFSGLSSEPAWNRSGGGFSSVYAAPSWQEVGSAARPITQNGSRGVPDVAAAAAYNFLYYSGSPAAGSGTSFSSPLWAGIIAEMDAIRGIPLGFVTPRLYAVGAGEESGSDALGLVDVSTGMNCVSTATSGWDTVTGWGTPRASLLYDDLSGTFVDLPLSASPSTVAPGGAVNIFASVTNATSHQPIVGVPVIFSLTAVGYSGPCGGSFAMKNVTTNLSGSATASLVVPACYVGGKASAMATVSSNGYFGSNVTTVDVNLLGLAGFLAIIQQFPYNVIAFVVLIIIATAIGLWIGGRKDRKRAREAQVIPAAVVGLPPAGYAYPPTPGEPSVPPYSAPAPSSLPPPKTPPVMPQR